MSNYLIHYGVKGQKWHDRKYQNEDGSLTQEGKIHYGVGDKKRDHFHLDTKKLSKYGQKELRKDNISKKEIARREEVRKNSNKVVSKVGMTAGIILGSAAAITLGKEVFDLVKLFKTNKVQSNPNIIDADDWETIGKLKFKDIGADQDYYNSDSYRYKSKY